MRPWLMMFKKDLRMSKLSLIGFGGLIVVSALFVSMSYSYAHGAEMSIGFMAMLMGPLMLYFPIHMLLSMRHEWQRSAPVWLHTPISGFLLLLSKMIVGFIYTVASFLVVVLFSYWILSIGFGQWGFGHGVVNLHDLLADLRIGLLFALLAMILAGLYMGVWAALISVSVQTVKNRWRKFSLVLGIIIFLIPTWGFSELFRLGFIRNLLHLGPFQIPIRYREFSTIPVPDHMIYPTFYTGEIVFYALVVAVVFYIAGWLLDRKVEV